MSKGAVNRQPGYRARNLQRRGFPYPESASWTPFNYPISAGSISKFFQNLKICKIFRSQNRSAGRGITRPVFYVWSWGFACLQLKPVSPTRFFYIENEFRNFPGERKIYSKIPVNCRPSITVFFLPGVLLTVWILSSASYEWPAESARLAN